MTVKITNDIAIIQSCFDRLKKLFDKPEGTLNPADRDAIAKAGAALLPILTRYGLFKAW